jgi:folate-binding protein YgfZ
MSMFVCYLAQRGILRIGGDDRRVFLQGLISNDINLCVGDKMLFAALLTPQGKFLHDMFIVDDGNSFLVDCELARADDLLRRLQSYKLRAKVTLENVSDRFDVWVEFDPSASSSRKRGSILANQPQEMDARLRGHDASWYGDPRLDVLGARAILPKDSQPEGTITDFATYDKHRLMLGVPDASRDMLIEKSTLVEGNFDLLNGISWTKGCYMGQELTARMHYRGLAKKRMFPVTIDGAAPSLGSLIQLNDEEIGEMRSSCDGLGIALLNVEKTIAVLQQNQILVSGDTKLKVFQPEWLIAATAQ